MPVGSSCNTSPVALVEKVMIKFYSENLLKQERNSSSFLDSTAQLRPWPSPQNPAEFLGGFSVIFFLQGRVVSPTPNPHPGGPGLCIYIP
jgi:hypothetical protein